MSTLQPTLPAVRPVSPWIWPGILIAGPAFVVVASIITAVFVLRHPDGLVASDYYKQGKAINAQLSQLQNAQQLGWNRLQIASGDGEVLLSIPGGLPARLSIEVTLAHPVDPARDIKRVLEVGADGRYHLALDRPLTERRRVFVTDVPARVWRVESILVPVRPQ